MGDDGVIAFVFQQTANSMQEGRLYQPLLSSLNSQLMGKKESAHNGTVTVCQMPELQIVML